MTEQKQRCIECGNDGPKPFCKGQCRKCYQRALRREKKGGAAAPTPSGKSLPQKKHRQPKTSDGNAVEFLSARAKARFDSAVAKAQADYDKAMEAVEIVADLAKDD